MQAQWCPWTKASCVPSKYFTLTNLGRRLMEKDSETGRKEAKVCLWRNGHRSTCHSTTKSQKGRKGRQQSLTTPSVIQKAFTFAPFLQTGKIGSKGIVSSFIRKKFLYLAHADKVTSRTGREGKHIAIWGIFCRKHILCKKEFQSCERETWLSVRGCCMRRGRSGGNQTKARQKPLFCSVWEICVR